MYYLKEDCSEDDVMYATKEQLYYTWKRIEKGAYYPENIVMLIAYEMTLYGM